MDVVYADHERCRGSYRCVRACPVKAIRIRGAHAEIVQERCIGCGTCVVACAQGAIRVRGDLDAVRQLLASDTVVAILAPEFAAAFADATPDQVEAGLARLGFYSIEDTVLGEEFVAVEYERMLAHLNGEMFIRSTCPAATEWLSRYHPDLARHLAPLISPMIAQGRLIKAIYKEPVKTVYIGPCVARKAEAADPQVEDAIDIVMTFSELERFFGEEKIDLAELPEFDEERNRPMLFKEASLIDGFPRDILARRSLLDTDVKVIRGSDSVGELAEAIEQGNRHPKIVDLLHCDGCIDGPAMATDTSMFARKEAVRSYFGERREVISAQIHFSDIQPRLPRIAMARGFVTQPMTDQLPTAEELARILGQAERDTPENKLDCGACGYDSCREQAVAVSRGLAEWEMCYPFQRSLLLHLVERLRELSVTDGLTGLINHRTFHERLEEELNRYRRYGSPVSVLMVDLDLFKEVNDSLGHVTGDTVLKAIAAVMSDSVRGSDIVARWGGDEFAVILPETDKTQAFAVAEKLRVMIEATPLKVSADGNETDLKMTISIGVAASDGAAATDQIVDAADNALYTAKAKGRNRTELGGTVQRGTPAPREEK